MLSVSEMARQYHENHVGGPPSLDFSDDTLNPSRCFPALTTSGFPKQDMEG